MSRPLLFPLLSALLWTQSPALAQDDPARSGWGGVVGGNVEAFESDRSAWQRSWLIVQRRAASGAASLETGHQRRNDETSVYIATDLYRSAGRLGYGNLRVEAAPQAQAVPQLAVLGEAYIALGDGWEGSVGARHLRFEADQVTLGIVSLGKYIGNSIGRVRVVVAPGEATAVSTVGTVRYLIDGVGGLTAPYIQGTIGQGQEPVVGPGGTPEVRRSWVAAVRGQRAIAQGVGLALGASYTADGTLTRWGVDAGLVARF
ncbi:MAG: YaiO family outer membrane beta-barrel protein [Bacteroidota bacterium]